MRRRVEAIDCRHWKLVLTGHSLGAGAASLVALYAHNFFPKYACALVPGILGRGQASGNVK